jgi:MoaA/NifB/PqqE/SkfB family radical SAM enzyme
VINKINYKYLPQFVESFIKMGISKFCFIYMVYEENLKKIHEQIAVKISEIIPYLNEAFEIVSVYKIDKSVLYNIPFCFFNQYSLHMAENIDFDTMVFTPSSVHHLDDNKHDNKIKFKVCEVCIYTSKCSGLLKTYCDIFGTNEIFPVIEK